MEICLFTLNVYQGCHIQSLGVVGNYYFSHFSRKWLWSNIAVASRSFQELPYIFHSAKAPFRHFFGNEYLYIYFAMRCDEWFVASLCVCFYLYPNLLTVFMLLILTKCNQLLFAFIFISKILDCSIRLVAWFKIDCVLHHLQMYILTALLIV